MSPQEELVNAVMKLDAEAKAMRLVVGFLLAENPEAVQRLKLLVPQLDDVTLQFLLSDDQRAHMKTTLAQLLATVLADARRTTGADLAPP
ncbi:MAG: hypothetical protein HYX47_05135 [Burkholderiales bacterium]|nr:hypothetical protein [Burkholderiales bacterium]